MRWQFWQQPVPQKLSEAVQKALLSQFTLDPLLTDRIRFLGRNGRFSGRPSHYIRIFDPTLIGNLANRVTANPTYDDLSENHEHHGALLFEGRTEKVYNDMRVFLTDRRAA